MYDLYQRQKIGRACKCSPFMHYSGSGAVFMWANNLFEMIHNI